MNNLASFIANYYIQRDNGTATQVMYDDMISRIEAHRRSMRQIPPVINVRVSTYWEGGKRVRRVVAL